jgi:hypothetical protein
MIFILQIVPEFPGALDIPVACPDSGPNSARASTGIIPLGANWFPSNYLAIFMVKTRYTDRPEGAVFTTDERKNPAQ